MLTVTIKLMVTVSISLIWSYLLTLKGDKAKSSSTLEHIHGTSKQHITLRTCCVTVTHAKSAIVTL